MEPAASHSSAALIHWSLLISTPLAARDLTPRWMILSTIPSLPFASSSLAAVIQICFSVGMFSRACVRDGNGKGRVHEKGAFTKKVRSRKRCVQEKRIAARVRQHSEGREYHPKHTAHASTSTARTRRRGKRELITKMRDILRANAPC